MARLRKLMFCVLLWLGVTNGSSWGVDSPSYYQRLNDGSYRYGYDAGDGFSARQSASSANEVVGQYAQLQPDGKIVNVRYRAGVGGFQPLGRGADGSSIGNQGASPYGGYSSSGRQSNAGGSLGGSTSANRGSVGLNGGSLASRSGSTSGLNGGSPIGDINSFGQSPQLGASFPFGTPVTTPVSVTPNIVSRIPYPGNPGTFRYGTTTPGRTGGNSGISQLAPAYYTTGAPQSRWNSLPANTRNTEPGDGSYRYSYPNGNSLQSDNANRNGNVRGTYPFRNDVGNSDQSYETGPRAGVRSTGGNLASPNGQKNHGTASSTSPTANANQPATGSTDGSYSFNYRTPDSARQETSDARGNVHGSYSFQNEDGNHDLSFVAGPNTGFRPTGGSLAVPNGLSQRGATPVVNTAQQPSTSKASTANNNGVSSDGLPQRTTSPIKQDFDNGNKLRNSFQNGQTNSPTGGDFAISSTSGQQGLTSTLTTARSPSNTDPLLRWTPTSVRQKQSRDREFLTTTTARPELAVIQSNSQNPDGSYRFSYKTPNLSRQESADADGTVSGSYSYQNEAGNNDLRYVAGAGVGFQPIGGNLAKPNQLGGGASERGQAGEGSGDRSYNFQYKIPNGSRRESADADGNVVGEYAYRDQAGQHNLRYSAGSGSGFRVTGGNLASSVQRNGDSSSNGHQNLKSRNNSGRGDDGSYNFSYDTGSNAHQESGDGRGRVNGRYSYSTNGQQRDLSYRVAPGTGFVVTGGNLATKNASP